MIATTTPATRAANNLDRRRRLIDLAIWVAGEHAKKELGLPSEWDQSTWMHKHGCHTTCCIAGKAALDSGAYPVLTLDYEEVLDPKLAADLWASDKDHTDDGKAIDFDFDNVYKPGMDEPRGVEYYAQDVLHLSSYDATRLFDGDNDFDAVLRIIRELLATTPTA